MLSPITTMNCRGTCVDLSRPVVMGILNLGPDSFYDGGKYGDVNAALTQAMHMLEEGATIIDIGGMTSRPGARAISTSEEAERVVPVIKAIKRERPDCLISIDAFRAAVVSEALNAGASIINDIYAGTYDEDILKLAKIHAAPIIAMHMQGDPEDMQENPAYEDVALSVLDFFIERVQAIRTAGVNDVLIDPGFGFGKTLDHNYELLQKLEVLNILDVPIVVGLSRKSMIYNLLEATSDDALNGTSALHMVALNKGAKILRVHDVKEACEVIKLWEKLNEE